LALERSVRAGHGRLVAALTRRFGVSCLALIEDAVQEAGLRALSYWHDGRMPEDMEGWLLRVAHNHIIDALRREQRNVELSSKDFGSTEPSLPELDDELRLVFLCCHPVLPRAAQVALTLRIAFGFSALQIARAFVSDERTVAQRIVRAKQRLRDEGVEFELPEPQELPARVGSILDVLYQVFTEGYAPTEGDQAINEELCESSLRLVRLLTDAAQTTSPAAEALRALFCFHASRVPARRADDGSLLLIQEQDRTRWDHDLIEEGFHFLGKSARGGDMSRFHVEAGIAAAHAAAETYAVTDWARIVTLYDTLRAIAPSPLVEVNRALAIAMNAGAPAGLDELDAIPERELLARNPYALAAYAELHASLGHLQEARAYLSRALQYQEALAQRSLLERKLAALEIR
jgi:RNA polymerase sigma-70 factor (ECF subfamily)